jgi:hypothetical protein
MFEARKGSHDNCVKSDVGTVLEGEKARSCSVSKVL